MHPAAQVGAPKLLKSWENMADYHCTASVTHVCARGDVRRKTTGGRGGEVSDKWTAKGTHFGRVQTT